MWPVAVLGFAMAIEGASDSNNAMKTLSLISNLLMPFKDRTQRIGDRIQFVPAHTQEQTLWTNNGRGMTAVSASADSLSR
jgi:hypothetical protein